VPRPGAAGSPTPRVVAQPIELRCCQTDHPRYCQRSGRLVGDDDPHRRHVGMIRRSGRRRDGRSRQSGRSFQPRARRRRYARPKQRFGRTRQNRGLRQPLAPSRPGPDRASAYCSTKRLGQLTRGARIRSSRPAEVSAQQTRIRRRAGIRAVCKAVCQLPCVASAKRGASLRWTRSSLLCARSRPNHSACSYSGEPSMPSSVTTSWAATA